MSDPVHLPQSGHAVTFHPHYTHRMERAFKEALSKGLVLREEGGQVVVQEVKADVLDRAAEAVLPLLIERVTKDGQDVAATPEWLLDLPERDFEVLRDRAIAVRQESERKKEAGKKNH